MNTYSRAEVSVGAFVAVGLLALVYMSVSIGGFRVRRPHYVITARFASVGDLKEGAPVKLAGVPVGNVERIELKNYAAETVLAIHAPLELPADTIASIRNSGLLGDDYVSLSPGAAAANLKPGSHITQTEPAVNLVELIADHAFGSPLQQKGGSDDANNDRDQDKVFSNPLR